MRTFKVVTEARHCRETGDTPFHAKPFGYVIQVHPPIISYKTSDDIEGVGHWTYRTPQRLTTRTTTWCKHKKTALQRLEEVKRSEYWNRPDEPCPTSANHRSPFGIGA